MSDKPKCRTCEFYRQDEDSTYCGVCLFRLPPGVRTGINIVQANVDHCDFHKPKEVKS